MTLLESLIPDKGQMTIRCFGLYANAHRGKVRKSEEVAYKLITIEEEGAKIPRRGWAAMIRKVYEVDPLVCPKCQGRMRIIAFLTHHAVVDRIINQVTGSHVEFFPRRVFEPLGLWSVYYKKEPGLPSPAGIADVYFDRYGDGIIENGSDVFRTVFLYRK